MQHPVAEHLGLERIDQRLQPPAAGAHPLCEGGARDGQAGARADAFLVVQRQVVSVLGHQHLAHSGDALVDHVRIDRRLGDGLTSEN